MRTNNAQSTPTSRAHSNASRARKVVEQTVKTGRKVVKDSVEISKKGSKLASTAKNGLKAAKEGAGLIKDALTPNVSSATKLIPSSGGSAKVGSKNENDEKKTAKEGEVKKESQTVEQVKENLENKKNIKKIKEAVKIETKLNGTIRKPAVFFIGGLELFSMTDYGGIKEMAENVKGARFYSWDQKEDMVREILKRRPEQPIVLVGHSLGADTAHEVSEELNTLEHGFRKVDLLITIDSVGTYNDIIPQNVAKNLNIFGEKNILFNDAPNVARNIHKTNVINELRSEFHTDLDDSTDVQYSILEAINTALASPKSAQKA